MVNMDLQLDKSVNMSVVPCATCNLYGAVMFVVDSGCQRGAKIAACALGWPTLGIASGVVIALIMPCRVPYGGQPQALPAALGYRTPGHILSPDVVQPYALPESLAQRLM